MLVTLELKKRMIKVKFVDFSSDAIKNKTMQILQNNFSEVIESDKPDFLFYSVFGYEHLKYDCVRIFWTGENIQPDFNICDYAIGFSYMSYEDRYVRVPLYYFYENDYQRALKKYLIDDKELEKKQKFCNYIYSNNNADRKREEFFWLLSQYKKVDSGGRHLNNIGGSVNDKYLFQKDFKFSIAFENSSTSGYTTEKILQAFAAETVPIYWGNPNVGRDFNEKAFINCHNYNSFEDVVGEIKKIDQDYELFRRYLKEPIGTYEQFPEDPLEKYSKFIISVCRQKPENAFRRNNLLIGERYQREQREFRFDKNKESFWEKLKTALKSK